jgi:chemotaxis protein methyltransferase CheR
VNGALSPLLLSQLSQLIEVWMGLFFPPERWADLERKLQMAAPAFACADAEACARFLTTTPITKEQLDLLATHLTVGETYFFREPRSLEVLEQQILPELLEQRCGVDQHLRVWSAACCTGEEPYSIAILLHRLMADLSSWRTTILATDISPRFLRKAVEGVYGQWSFRSVSSTLREQYFSRTPSGHFAIRPTLKNMVHFAQLNLVEDVYPAATNNTADMDVILCRNVLIYFTAERIKRIIEQFHHTVIDGGWLIVSPVETAFVMDSPFTPVQFPGVTLFRKDPRRQTVSIPFGLFGLPVSSDPVEHRTATPTVNETVLVGASVAPTVALASDAVYPHADHISPTTSIHAAASSSPLYDEARELYARGQYAQAIEKLLTLRRQPGRGGPSPFTPLQEQTMALLARAHANQGQLPEAQSWCEQALTVNKCDPGLHYLRATILLECGQEAEARLSLTRALYLDQHFVLAHFALGNMARQRKEFKEAEKHFDNTLALLQRHQPEDILPESEGMSAGRLAQIIADMSERL